MNVDTGEVKDLSELTDAEKKSGKWKELPAHISAAEIQGLQSLNRKQRRAALAQMRRKARKATK